MSTTNFIDGSTPVVADWLNDVDDAVYNQLPTKVGTDALLAYATKVELETAVPDQTGQTGKFLQTDGTNTSWETVSSAGGDLLSTNNLSDLANITTARANLGLGTAATKNTGTSVGDVVEVQTGGKLPVLDGSNLTSLPSSLPSQTGNSGKLLTTDGTNASWTTLSGIRAFVNFNGTLTGTISPRRSSGITSVVKTATGKYTITLSSAITDFIMIGNCRTVDSGNSTAVVAVEYNTTPTTTVVNVTVTNPQIGFVDSVYVYLAFI